MAGAEKKLTDRGHDNCGSTVSRRIIFVQKKMGNKLLCASSCTNQDKNWDFGSQFCHYLYVLQKGPQKNYIFVIFIPAKMTMSPSPEHNIIMEKQ